MTGRMWRLCATVLSVMVLAADVAAAQPIVILPDHITLGGTVYSSANSAVADEAPEFAASLELPVYWPFRIRIDTARTRWEQEGRTSNEPARPATLARGTVSLVKAVDPRRLGKPIGAYAGVGVGLYRYARYPDEPARVRRGFNLLAGIELTLPNDRLVLGWEIQGLASGGRSAIQSGSDLLALQAGMAFRYRF